MKKVIEKHSPLTYESPQPSTGVLDESNMVKMEFEVIMGLYRKGLCLIKNEYQMSKQ